MRAGRLSALTLVVLAVALGGAACGDSTAKKQKAAAQRRAEVHWRAGLGRWNMQMLEALTGISLLLSRPGPVAALQAADPKTTARLTDFDRTLERCSAIVESLGPFSAGLAEPRELALRACSNLERGARLLEAGISAMQRGLGSDLIDRATPPLSAGQDDLDAAQAALREPAP